MRDIFFEDEIDYFRETATSILCHFVQGRYCITAASILLKLINDIEKGLDTEKIIQKIDFKNICDSILEEEKNNMIILEYIDEEALQQTACALESPHFRELMATLNNLFYAVQNKSSYLKEHQEQLIQIEKDEDQQCDWLGNSRLLLALKREDIHQALNFIDRGMFINRENRSGQTPLMLAAKLGSDRLIEALLAKGANLDAGTRFNRPFETALYVAITERKQSAATLLMSAGAQVNFEIKTYLSNKPEIYSLTDLAKKFKIDLNTTSELKLAV